MTSFSCGIAVGLALLAAPVQAASPSFDCAKAGTATEHAICASDVLAGLDRHLAEAYRAARAGAGETGVAQIRADQVAWIARRDACGGDAGCIEDRMEARLRQLQSLLANGLADSGLSGAYCAGADLLLVEDDGGSVEFSISSFQGGGHSCGTGRVRATQSGPEYVGQADGCSFRLTVADDRIVFTSGGEPECRQFCGARASFGTHIFPFSTRRSAPPEWTTAGESGGC
ncbi:lysozyme inhibitor LprI family protein [Tropicimonas isoalkanivorans]|uniref:Lysozyme inhibitor LprI-like N-terminal domain-containing protein n=1 Tax=Tropicimonas isoalkanivorans TaxID=441112 RepID=A0A1I1JQG1_9RHOB|nr:lysozyme inhibitor LprI family protein [Tropicimonas isoalkanivorans]SFC50736.1 Protein of unknown function [Tropicimonas isoalkanivorans]